MKKIIIYVILIFALLVAIGISLNYYINRNIEPEELRCYKGKLLIRIEENNHVYSKVNNISCDYDKGMLIIEEQS
jgi:hypothetical protein